MYTLSDKNSQLSEYIQSVPNFDSLEVLSKYGIKDKESAIPHRNFISYLAKGHLFSSDGRPEVACEVLKPLMIKELSKIKIETHEPCNLKEIQKNKTKTFIENIFLLNIILQDERAKGFRKLVRDKKCIACHDKSGIVKVGPDIPFLNDRDLSKRLKNDKDYYKKFENRTDPKVEDVSRMPLGQPALNQKERQEILEYLKGLMQ